jgi:hypothetical protein
MRDARQIVNGDGRTGTVAFQLVKEPVEHRTASASCGMVGVPPWVDVETNGEAGNETLWVTPNC